eukprot:symbB.v1.2.040527.t1/scaffold7308.1/size12020/1
MPFKRLRGRSTRCAERARPSCIAFLNAKGEMCKREN